MNNIFVMMNFTTGKKNIYIPCETIIHYELYIIAMNIKSMLIKVETVLSASS